MASGWNLWVWLQCLGVASQCCYKEIYRYPHNNYKFFLTPLVLGLFLAAASLLLCSFLKCFFGLKNKNIETEMAIFNFARRARKLRYYGDVIHPSYRKSAVEHDGGV